MAIIQQAPVTPTSRTWGLDFKHKKVTGVVDGKRAVLQAILIRLSTIKYGYPIYSFVYGSSFNDLVGKDLPYICTAIPRYLHDCVSYDDRILDITNIHIDKGKSIDSLQVSFTVNTIFGEISAAQGVQI
jgi:hypothetical protein